jgi:hypothetical protein
LPVEATFIITKHNVAATSPTNDPPTPATGWRFKRRDQLEMMRDELLKRITALPSEADVGVQIGDGHVEIADLVPWGDGNFIALKCHPNDLHDLLLEWGLPNEQRGRIAPRR